MLEIISKRSRTSEKQIIFLIYAAQRAHLAQEKSNKGFLRSSYNLADGLNKPKVQAALIQRLTAAYAKTNVE